jgi:chromosome segregation ATPase
MSSEYTGDFAQMLQELTVREMEIARLKDMLERTEAQIHADGGYVDQVVALEEENSNLLALIATLEESVEYLRTSRDEAEEEIGGLLRSITTLEESVEYLRTSRDEARAERDALRIELEELRDKIDAEEG